MCCRRNLSEFLIIKKCFCGIPLKAATYVTGGLMLIYCIFTEIESFQALMSPVFYDDEYMDAVAQLNITPAIVPGSGVGTADYILRQQKGDKINNEYLQIIFRGLIIGWTVINGLFIISTCVMIYGNAKSKPMLLLQWLVISATIAIGNIIDIIFAIVYMAQSSGRVTYPVWKGSAFHLIQCILESGGIIFGFVVVRSHYYHLSLPSIEVSFKTLESRDASDEAGGSGQT